MKKTLLAASVAATALLAAPLASAAWTTFSGSLNVIVQSVATAKDDVAAQTDIVYTLGAGESLTANDTITITLTGGATFDGTTSITALPSAGDIGGGATTAAVPLSGGTAGSTVAVWRVISPVAATSLLTFNTTGTIFDVAALTAGSKVDMNITLQTSTGLSIGTANTSVSAAAVAANTPTFNGSIFTGTNLISGGTNVSVSSTADVAESYKKFTGAASAVLTNDATLAVTSNNAASIPTQAFAANKVLYKLTGDFTGIASIAAVAPTALVGSSATGAAVVGTGAVAAGFVITADKTAAYASNSALVAAGNGLGLTALNVTLDGTSVQGARTFMLSVDVLADTSHTAHEAIAPVAIQVITRNGTFFTTNSSGGLNNIKVTDLSGILPTAGGDITVMAWDASGTSVAAAADAVALPKVPNNGTAVIAGTMLTGNFPGAVRFDVTVNSSKAVISNVKKTADGTTITVYGNATNAL